MNDEERINFCNAMLERIVDKKTFELKMRYQLETFFFHEGWASHTNPKNGKEGFTHQWTYNDDTIKHFIEDIVRWSQYEFEHSQKQHKIQVEKVDK